MGDFLFFGTKKYFFGVKIERKNVEKYRIYTFWDRKKYFYLLQNILECPVNHQECCRTPMTGNSSTMHPERHGIMDDWTFELI